MTPRPAAEEILLPETLYHSDLSGLILANFDCNGIATGVEIPDAERSRHDDSVILLEATL